MHDEILSIVVIIQNKNFMGYDLKNASKQYEYFICYLFPFLEIVFPSQSDD